MHLTTDVIADTHLHSSSADPACTKDDLFVLIRQVLDDGLPQAVELEVCFSNIMSLTSSTLLDLLLTIGVVQILDELVSAGKEGGGNEQRKRVSVVL